MSFCKRTLALILALIMLCTVLAACNNGKKDPDNKPVGGGKPVTGGDLTVGIAQDLDATLNPHNMVSAGTRELLFNIYEGLVKPDTEGNLVPAVASSVEVADSGDSFAFTLRDDVYFHNGEKVTVEDVVYSLTRAAGLETDKPLMDGMEIVDSVEATGDSRIVVTLSEPDIEALAQMTAAIIPEGNDPSVDVIGTGPFKFVSRVPQETIKIEKFDKYWGEPAFVDSVTYQVIDNAETLVMSLMSGAIDLATHLTSSQISELGDGYNVVEGTMNLVQAIYLNNAAPPFDNVNVRRALSLAVNRQEIMDFIAGGRGTVLGSSMYPAFKKYFREDLVDYYSLDLEKAKSLLAEAGYANGFTMTITAPSNYKPHVDTATVIAEQLKPLGITVEVELVDWESWLNNVYVGRDFQSTVIGLDAKYLTARSMLERFTSDYGENFINFNNAEYDKIFKQAIASTDDEEQTQLYGRLQGILTEQAANLYIQDLCDIVAMQANVGGYEFYPLYVMDMSKVYFTE